MTPVFFHDQKEFRTWMENNHKTESELLVGYYKVGSGKPSMSWSQSVDEALCFGWIDGIRKSIDNERYCIRFTPRKATSIWSNINIKKVEQLIQNGLMTQSGLEVFKNRKISKSGISGYNSLSFSQYPINPVPFTFNILSDVSYNSYILALIKNYFVCRYNAES